jgi:ferrous iron transport protein A
MTLERAKRGEKIEIIRIDNADIRAQVIRLGISEGSQLICSEKLFAGPIILQNKMQEIAIGRRLAKQIRIVKVEQ